jgi:hypothetical protein
MATTRRRLSLFLELLPMVLLVASLGLNVCLALNLKRSAHESSLQSPVLRVGNRMPMLWVIAPGGNREKLDWSERGRPTLLYMFTPTCIWCERNLQNILSLEHDTQGEYDFVGLSLTSDGLADYLKRSSHLDHTYYIEGGEHSLFSMSIAETPETIVVSREGLIEDIWFGAYSGATRKSVESAFRRELPGLTGP